MLKLLQKITVYSLGLSVVAHTNQLTAMNAAKLDRNPHKTSSTGAKARRRAYEERARVRMELTSGRLDRTTPPPPFEFPAPRPHTAAELAVLARHAKLRANPKGAYEYRTLVLGPDTAFECYSELGRNWGLQLPTSAGNSEPRREFIEIGGWCGKTVWTQTWENEEHSSRPAMLEQWPKNGGWCQVWDENSGAWKMPLPVIEPGTARVFIKQSKSGLVDGGGTWSSFSSDVATYPTDFEADNDNCLQSCCRRLKCAIKPAAKSMAD